MKYSFADIFAIACHQAQIKRIWKVTDHHEQQELFSSLHLPPIITLHNPDLTVVAAAAEAQHNEHIGVCLFPSLNTIIAALSALHAINANGIPLVIIGIVDTYDEPLEYEYDQLLLSCSFAVKHIQQAKQLQDTLFTTFQETAAQDSISMLLVEKELVNAVEFEKRERRQIHLPNPIHIPSEQALREIVETIKHEDQTVIVCDAKCRKSMPLIHQLAELIQAPIVGVSAVSPAEVNPFWVGTVGKWSDRTAFKAIHDAHVVLLLGAIHPEFMPLHRNQLIIQLSQNQEQSFDLLLHKKIYQGNIAETIASVLPSLVQKPKNTFLSSLQKLYNETQNQLASLQIPPHLALLVERLDAVNVTLCTQGYAATLLEYHFIVNKNHPNLHLSDAITKRGSVIYEAIGLLADKKNHPVVALIDHHTVIQDLSGILYFSQKDMPLKLVYLNQEKGEVAHDKLYQQLCKAMDVSYYCMGADDYSNEVLTHWINQPRTAFLEIKDCFVPADWLIEASKLQPESRIVPFIEKVTRCKTNGLMGPILCDKSLFATDITLLPKQVITLEDASALFYAAMGTYQKHPGIPICVIRGLNDLLRMTPGLLEAKRYHIPIVCLACYRLGSSRKGQQDHIMLMDLLSAFSSYAYIVDDTEQNLNYILGEALAQAKAHDDLSMVFVDERYVETINLEKAYDPPYAHPELYPNVQELEHVARLINSSKATAIFVGHGARNAHREVISLSRKIKAPVGWTFRVKDQYDFDNFYPMGLNGILCEPTLKEAYRKCEVLLLLGTNLCAPCQVNKHAKVIQIDTEIVHLGKPCDVDYAIQGDIKQTLDRLYPLLLTCSEYGFADKMARQFEKYKADLLQQVTHKASLYQQVLVDDFFVTLNQRLPSDAWVVADMFMPWILTAKYIDSQGSRRLFVSGDSIFTSSSTAFAYGARCDAPHQVTTILTTADALHNQIQILRQICHDTRAIKIFILRLVDEKQPCLFTDLPLGGRYKRYKITSRDRISPIIKQTLQEPGPTVIDVLVRKETLSETPAKFPYYLQKYAPLLRELYLNAEKQESTHASTFFKKND